MEYAVALWSYSLISNKWAMLEPLTGLSCGQDPRYHAPWYYNGRIYIIYTSNGDIPDFTIMSIYPISYEIKNVSLPVSGEGNYTRVGGSPGFR